MNAAARSPPSPSINGRCRKIPNRSAKPSADSPRAPSTRSCSPPPSRPITSSQSPKRRSLVGEIRAGPRSRRHRLHRAHHHRSPHRPRHPARFRAKPSQDGHDGGRLGPRNPPLRREQAAEPAMKFIGLAFLIPCGVAVGYIMGSGSIALPHPFPLHRFADCGRARRPLRHDPRGRRATPGA